MRAALEQEHRQSYDYQLRESTFGLHS
jgi:hypothetical protein